MTPRAPADQPVRDRIAHDFDTTFLLDATAGTGKATVLVERLLALVRALHKATNQPVTATLSLVRSGHFVRPAETVEVP